MLHRLWKPWYVYRPFQLLRRLRGAIFPRAPGYQQLQTSWGATLYADPTKTIGQNLTVAGIYDPPLSELLFRLIQEGDTVVDVGANVGYTTLLAALSVGGKGKVYGFEPHPELFQILKKNVEWIQKECNSGQVELHQAALGDYVGNAELTVPTHFQKTNDGISYIAKSKRPNVSTVPVEMQTFDNIIRSDQVRILKIDVEGFELNVLQGAERALAAKAVKHVIFEDHHISESKVVPLLKLHGYHVFSLGWRFQGPIIRPVELGSLATGLDAPNFVATLVPSELDAALKPNGWRTLQDIVTPRRRKCKSREDSSAHDDA